MRNFVVILAVLVAGDGSLKAEAPSDVNPTALRHASDETRPADDAEKAWLEVAGKHVSRLALQDANGDSIEIIGHPLLSFGDPTRGHVTGALFAWGKAGRPQAVMELWRDGEDSYWNQSITLTSPDSVVLTTSEAGRWQPMDTLTEPTAIPNAPQASMRAVGRLRQLKNLARRFSAHEFWDPNNSRYELRLLVQPIHRYNDLSQRVIDGALFIFAHGTNPEVVLLIELHGKSLDGAEWKYAAARSTHAELHIELDGGKVWSCPRADDQLLKSTKAYWAFRSPLEASSTGRPKP